MAPVTISLKFFKTLATVSSPQDRCLKCGQNIFFSKALFFHKQSCQAIRSSHIFSMDWPTDKPTYRRSCWVNQDIMHIEVNFSKAKHNMFVWFVGLGITFIEFLRVLVPYNYQILSVLEPYNTPCLRVLGMIKYKGHIPLNFWRF